MNERLIYVMGPSGAGKDSLLEWLKQHVSANAPMHWARRTITRDAESGGERHEAMNMTAFRATRTAGKFAMDWEANGLGYGVRHRELAPLEYGHWVMVNGSRAHFDTARRHFPGLTAVHVSASPATLARRLIERSRETEEQIQARIARHAAFRLPAGVIEISNETSLELAGKDFLNALKRLPGWHENVTA